ncbi:MAG: polysaccharide biosynthesis tyrosine autokinase [Planctomycetes bacterium]|nr:polysaccharide biosynthesis tyrosine autokinase [Planctomycetota bacterium]
MGEPVNGNNAVRRADGPVPAPALGAPGDSGRPSLVHTIWRRRWIVALAVVASLVAGWVHLDMTTPLYTSTSRVYVERLVPRIIPGTEDFTMGPWSYLNTQCALFKSTPIAAEALKRPGIRELRTFAGVGNPVGYLKAMLRAQLGKGDDIISISFESPYPEDAAQIVNAVVDAYITYQNASKRNTAAEVLKILQREKAKRDAELANALKAMVDFKKSNPLLAFEGSDGSFMSKRMEAYSAALIAVESEILDGTATYEAAKETANDPTRLRHFVELRRLLGSGSAAAPEESLLRAEVARLEVQLAEMKRECTDEHPGMQALEARLAERKQRLAELEKRLAEAELLVAAPRLETLKKKEAQIRASFEEQRKEMVDLNAQAAQYTLFRSEWEQARKLCDMIDDRIRQINVNEDTGALNITILEVAVPAGGPSSPDKRHTMAMALIIGVMLGVGLAMAREWLDQRFHSADEISTALGAPILGMIPQMPGKESLAARGRKVEAEPASHAAEAYRTVRTAIYFGVPNGQAKRIVVTSPEPGDGKTTLVSNLAIAMAQAGQRVLIIDGDFRKPMQHRVFEIERERGLSSVLAGREPLDAVIQRTKVGCLDVLPTGPIPPNPSEMLNSQAFAGLLDEVSARYDHILIDSPPVMPVTDARILGAVCDVTILTVRAERSHRKVAERARDGLLSVGAQILGVVVNAVPRKEDRYYHYSGYGYYYKYGYGYGYGHGRRREKRGGTSQDDGRDGDGPALATPSVEDVE